MLDPNIRPGFIRDFERYRDRLDRMIAVADIAKVSDEDLNWIYPGHDALGAKIAKVRASGPTMVILTRGGEGATAYLADGTEIAAAAETVGIVDRVGAGDTFNAGVLAQLSEDGRLAPDRFKTITAKQTHDALAFGAKVAGVTVSRAGANPPWRHEV